jgi:hypothetical protein
MRGERRTLAELAEELNKIAGELQYYGQLSGDKRYTPLRRHELRGCAVLGVECYGLSLQVNKKSEAIGQGWGHPA